MGYLSKGRKPIERASKIAHIEIIKNPEVVAYVEQCVLPSAPAVDRLSAKLTDLEAAKDSEVAAVIAVDGGYSETYVRQEYPSACVTFFSLGAVLFRLSDLRGLDSKRFIAPEDLHRLKNIERYTLVLPTKGIRHASQATLASTIRNAIYAFFEKSRGSDDEHLLGSLRWFLFRRWKRPTDDSFEVSVEHCPSGCGHGPITWTFRDPTAVDCPGCGQPVYLTDCFRLHERIDEEVGASAIAAYVMTMLEQMVLVHMINTILTIRPALLREFLFIKDGPLAFFGVVAPLYRPMRELVEYLIAEPGGHSGPLLRLAGLEKSGAFVEHAAMIQDAMRPGSFFVVDDAYIRKYIVPGGAAGATYGQNTYYGQKVFFRSAAGQMYVATIPAVTYMADAKPEDLPHLHEVLGLVAELRCDMYDNALLPVALANKLVSLSDFPSQRILTTFVRLGVK